MENKQNQRENEKWETLTKRYLAIERQIRIKQEEIKQTKDRLQIDEETNIYISLSAQIRERTDIQHSEING